jgi:hypothetical protein
VVVGDRECGLLNLRARAVEEAGNGSTSSTTGSTAIVVVVVVVVVVAEDDGGSLLDEEEDGLGGRLGRRGLRRQGVAESTDGQRELGLGTALTRWDVRHPRHRRPVVFARGRNFVEGLQLAEPRGGRAVRLRLRQTA